MERLFFQPENVSFHCAGNAGYRPAKHGLMSQYFNIPFRETLRNYSLEKIRADGIAGATVALLAVPQCMAYALLAGLEPVAGLYAGMVGVVVASVLGGSRYVITGPTANVSLVVGGVLLTVSNPGEAVLILTLLVGGFQILFAVLRLGNLAKFVSRPVVTGFITGVICVIVGEQFLAMAGFSGGESPYFAKRLYVAFSSIIAGEAITYPSLFVGIASILLMIIFRRIHERFPAGLVTIVVGGTVAYFLGWEANEAIEIVGDIPSGLPTPVLPELNPERFADLFPGAMAITILATVQTVSVTKSIASESLETVDENQDLIGQGASNIFSGIFGGYPVCASFSRSYFSYSIGSRTRMAGVICGAGIALVTAFATDLARYIPKAVLYGLIVVVVWEGFPWNDIKVAMTATRRDRGAFLTTFLTFLFLKVDWAIYAGVGVSIVLYVWKATSLDLKEYIVDEEGELKHIMDYNDRIDPRVALIEVSGEAFFGSADQIRDRINELCEESDELRVIVLRMKNAMNLDITGAQVLKEIAMELRDRDKTLMLSGTTPDVREVLDESDVDDVIGQDKILVAQKDLLASTRQAIERAQSHIDDVLEGEEERGEEDPPLKHTMEDLESAEEGEEEHEQDPVEEEKVQPE